MRLSRFDFRGRRVLMFGILMTRIIPVSATIAPLYLIVQWLKLIDTYQGMIVVLAAQQLPLAIWLMKGFFDTVPGELEEAAWVDGASRLTSALRIVLPLAAPGVGAVALFAFIESWGDFLTPLILITSSDKTPISIGLFQAFSYRNQVDWGLLDGDLGRLHGPDDHPVPPGPPLPDQGDRGRRHPGRRLSRGAGPLDGPWTVHRLRTAGRRSRPPSTSPSDIGATAIEIAVGGVSEMTHADTETLLADRRCADSVP